MKGFLNIPWHPPYNNLYLACKIHVNVPSFPDQLQYTVVRLWIFVGYKVLRFWKSYFICKVQFWVTFVLVTWKHTCVRICKISCMSSGDDNDLDRLLAEPAGRLMLQLPWAATLWRHGSGTGGPLPGTAVERRGGGPCQGPFVSLANSLPWPHLCNFSHMKSVGILLTLEKIYAHKT